MTNLFEVLEEQVQDLYNAENQLAKAMPKLAKKAKSPELKQSMVRHLEETKVQIDRLKQVAETLGIKPTGKVCKAMKGLIEESSEVLEEEGSTGANDAALIAAAQRVEHYEISAYGTAIALANATGQTKIVKALQQTLAEEKRTDELLTTCAEQMIYPGTPKTEDDEQEEEMPAKKSAKKTTKRK